MAELSRLGFVMDVTLWRKGRSLGAGVPLCQFVLERVAKYVYMYMRVCLLVSRSSNAHCGLRFNDSLGEKSL